MPPSRRQVLRASAFALPLLAGCATSDGAQNTTSTNARTSTTRSSTTQPTTDPPSLSCGTGPLPDDGWPLPARSVGGLNYAPDASGPTAKPSAHWTVTSEEPDANSAQFTRPVVAAGQVFTGRALYPPPERQLSGDQEVHAYDAASGDLNWRAPVPGKPESVFATDDAVVAFHGGQLTGLSPDDGAKLWATNVTPYPQRVLPTPAGILASIRTEDDGSDDELRSLDVAGDVQWRVGIPSTVGSGLAWADERAYVATTDAELVAVDTADQSVAWTRDLQDGEDTAPARLVATPCAVFATIDGVLYGVSRSGTEAWATETRTRGVAFDGDAVYGVGQQGYVRRVTTDGEQQWEAFYGRENHRYTDGFLTDPALDGETLYAGTLDGKLVAASAGDGSERWVLERGWENEPRVSVVDDTVYAAWGRHLAAFR